MQEPDEAKIKAMKEFLATVEDSEIKGLLDGYCETLDPRRLALDYERMVEKGNEAETN